jgi:omega-hydroxy-beta-dihydromenaquinone-9 sulfotransferase
MALIDEKKQKRSEAGTAATDPIFVVGYMHSGTTLLQNALLRNSAVFSTRGETKYFDYLPMTVSRYRDLGQDDVVRRLIRFTVELIYAGYTLNREAQAVKPWPELSETEIDQIARSLPSRDYPQVFASVMDHLTRRESKTRWLEKTPTHIFSIDRIATGIPTARFIEIVRDPRDVLASKKTRRETVWSTKRYQEKQRPWKNLEKAYDPLWDALSWKAAIQAGMGAQRKYADRMFRIRYEDLVEDPQRELSKMCAFLGMEFEREMLDVPAGQPANADAQRGRGIAGDSVGRWTHVFSEPETALVQAVTEKEIRALGYDYQPVRIAAKYRSVGLIAGSIGEFFGRLVRRTRMGGTKYLSLVMGNYVRRAARIVGNR